MCIFLMGLFSRAQNTNVKQPNILFIINDDQDAKTLGVYGDNACATPNIDKLASEGMSLTSAHHMGSFRAAVCTPSRCMLMTGRSVWETQNLNVNYPPLDYTHKMEENYTKISAKDPAITTFSPNFWIAWGACSRLEPQPKLSSLMRISAPACSGRSKG